MRHGNKHKRYAKTFCLIFSQLLTFHVAAANTSDGLVLDNPTQSVSAVAKNKRTSSYRRPLIFGLPSGGEFIISADMGYTNSNYADSVMVNSYRQSTSQSSAMNSSISASYGFTENLYSKISASYSNGTSSTTRTDSAHPGNNSDSKSTYDGFSEPDLLVGAQARLGKTQLFTELSVDIPMGEKVSKETSLNETSSNNLNGGTSYSPHLGIVQDLGSVFLIGGASYTFNQERTSREEYYPKTKTYKKNGGNNLSVLAGMEFKHLANLGMMLGYAKIESSETKIVETNETWTSSGDRGILMATTYFSFKLSNNMMLMPRLTYATILDREIKTGPYTITIDRSDSWNAGLAARLNF